MAVASSRLWLYAFFAGFAQLVFCSTLPAGILVALGLGLFSPWMLAGAAAGCLAGTLAGRLTPGMTPQSWAAGLAGFNPAILGVLGAGVLAAGRQEAIWLPISFLAAAGLGWAMTNSFNRLGLYPLSAPAYLIALLASLALAPAGTWWWSSVDTLTFGGFGPWIATLCILAAMSYEAPEAAGWAVLSAVLAYFLATVFLGLQPSEAAGLWGIVAPLSAFASARLFGKRAVAALALGAAAMAAIIWLIWQFSPLGAIAPPLIAPMIIALWIVMILRRYPLPVLAQTTFWACFAAMVRARRNGLLVGVVTGPSPIEIEGRDENDGDKRLDVGDRRDWQKLWATADRLRNLDTSVTSGSSVAAVREAVGANVVDLVIAGDAIGQFDGIDEAKRIDAAGRADRLSCLACGGTAPWPPAALWRRMALRCTCGGLLLPDMRPLDTIGERALETRVLKLCGVPPGVLIVLDRPGCETPASQSLLNRIKANGGTVFRVSPSASCADQGFRQGRRMLGEAAFVIRALKWLVARTPKPDRSSGKLGRCEAGTGAMV